MRTIYYAIFHNSFIKIIALILAILTWSYIASQLYVHAPPEQPKDSEAVVNIADEGVVVKRVPVHINLAGKPDERYRVIINKIKIRPSICVITGPLKEVENISFITTEPILINNATKTIRQKAQLKEIPGCAISKDQEFYVTIPIVRQRAK